jgi:hypothetical protein
VTSWDDDVTPDRHRQVAGRDVDRLGVGYQAAAQAGEVVGQIQRAEHDAGPDQGTPQ